MSLQDIISKILAEAEKEAKKIHDEAMEKVSLIKKESLEMQENTKLEIEKNVDKKIEKALKKSESLANMNGRMDVLKRKQELVDTTLKILVEKLSSLPAKEYEQILSKLMLKIDLDSATILPATGKENSTKGAIKIANKNFNVGDSQDIQGGFYVVSDVVDMDFSFETIVYKNLKKDLEEKIVNSL